MNASIPFSDASINALRSHSPHPNREGELRPGIRFVWKFGV